MFIKTLCVFLLLMSTTAMATEEPNYTVIEQADEYELREYDAMIVAEVLVSGEMDEASSKGFRLIADFIFGNNTASNGTKEEIQMTAPVTIEPRSEKINMTKPVTIKEEEGKWRVHFVMPREYTLDSLPTPNKKEVNLRQIPALKYAVIRFSGFTDETKIADKTAKLINWMNSKGLSANGLAQLARYNPPWTLPFMRRNEIMIPY